MIDNTLQDSKDIKLLQYLNAEVSFSSNSYFYTWGGMGILFSLLGSLFCYQWGPSFWGIFALYPLISTITISLLRKRSTLKTETNKSTTRVWIYFTDCYFFLAAFSWIANVFLEYNSSIGIMVDNIILPGVISSILGITAGKKYFYKCGLFSSLLGMIAICLMIEFADDYHIGIIYSVIFFFAFIIPQYLTSTRE